MARSRRLTFLVSLLIVSTAAMWGFLTVRETVSEGLVMGSQAPELNLPDLSGSTWQLDDLSGTPILLRFSSRTCNYCSDDFAYLEALQNEYDGRVRVVAVELGVPRQMVIDAVAGKATSYPVLVDVSGEVADRYRVANVPMLYFIDAYGRLTSSVRGEPMQIDLIPHLAAIMAPLRGSHPAVNAEVEAIAQLVRCQECQGRSVWESMVPSAWDMIDRIQEMVYQGLTRQAVLDRLVDEYGPWILMTPPKKGSGLWAYAMPFAFLGIGGLLVQWFLSRRRSVASRNSTEKANVDPAVVDEVERRLRDYL